MTSWHLYVVRGQFSETEVLPKCTVMFFEPISLEQRNVPPVNQNPPECILVVDRNPAEVALQLSMNEVVCDYKGPLTPDDERFIKQNLNFLINADEFKFGVWDRNSGPSLNAIVNGLERDVTATRVKEVFTEQERKMFVMQGVNGFRFLLEWLEQGEDRVREHLLKWLHEKPTINPFEEN